MVDPIFLEPWQHLPVEKLRPNASATFPTGKKEIVENILG